MPSVDHCHDQVIHALQKGGWRLERAPFNLATETRTAYVDAEFSRKVNGTHQQIMVVEVKCFPAENTTTRDLYAAIGQYLVYRAMIIKNAIPYPLYLAVPSKNFDTIFDEAVMLVIEMSKINLILIDLDNEAVVRWIQH